MNTPLLAQTSPVATVAVGCLALVAAVIVVLWWKGRARAAGRREMGDIACIMGALGLEGVIVMDGEGRITFWSDDAARMFGYDREEAVGRRLGALLLSGEHQGACHDAIARLGSASPPRQSLEVVARRKGGAEWPVELALSSLQWRGRARVVGMVRDGMAIQDAAAQLRRAKEEVETVNSQLEEAIEQANKLAVAAECANIAKSAFLANMSHEIRTPMNGIIGMTGLLLDTEMDEEQREYAETIKSSAEALLTIVNDILDFSKIEAGKMGLETLDFDLRTAVEEMNDVLALHAHKKGLELACLIEPDVPVRLRGDPGRLRQILTNLVSNAIKFTHQGEVSIQVRRESETAEGVIIRFAVCDTGIGIAQDKLGLLFQPFTQADSSTTRKFGGTGLGLSICKRLAAMMGGEIGVESRLGQGSEFWFTARFPQQPASPPAEADEEMDLAGARVLVVDDSPASRRALAGCLARWRCRHEEAPDAATALARLREAAAANDPFRVAVLDAVMPDGDGVALGRRIHADPVLRQTLLVLMDASLRRGDASRSGQVEFAARLTKPVKRAQFQQCLVTALRHGLDPAFFQSQIIAPPSPEPAHHNRRRILVAEDNITNQKVAVKVLEKLGYQADAAANGLEAVKALETMPYDLVLMDVQMPEMDGLAATQYIRSPMSAVLNRRIPIIAMTAHALQGDRERCLAAGMDDYVSKPVQPKELAGAIARCLKAPLPAKQTHNTTKLIRRTQILDRAALVKRLDGDEGLIASLFDVFFQDAPAQILGMAAAIERGDMAEARRRAHSLKGASANLSALALAKAAAEMEQAAQAGDVARLGAVLPLVREEFDSLRRLVAASAGAVQDAAPSAAAGAASVPAGAAAGGQPESCVPLSA